jgi:hypothetical protein
MLNQCKITLIREADETVNRIIDDFSFINSDFRQEFEIRKTWPKILPFRGFAKKEARKELGCS